MSKLLHAESYDYHRFTERLRSGAVVTWEFYGTHLPNDNGEALIIRHCPPEHAEPHSFEITGLDGCSLVDHGYACRAIEDWKARITKEARRKAS
jgi:hypothetical protein